MILLIKDSQSLCKVDMVGDVLGFHLGVTWTVCSATPIICDCLHRTSRAKSRFALMVIDNPLSCKGLYMSAVCMIMLKNAQNVLHSRAYLLRKTVVFWSCSDASSSLRMMGSVTASTRVYDTM